MSAAPSTSSLVFAGSIVNGPTAFDPIGRSAELTDVPGLLNHEPWAIPEGYTQHVMTATLDGEYEPAWERYKRKAGSLILM